MEDANDDQRRQTHCDPAGAEPAAGEEGVASGGGGGGGANADLDTIPGTRTGGGRKLAVAFTCAVCETRSLKQFTEQAYVRGVVIVRCPGCSNLHLIADRLGYFDDGNGGDFDLETVAALRNEKIVRRTVAAGEGGGGRDVESVYEVSLEELIGKSKMEELLLRHEQQQHRGEEGHDEATETPNKPPP